MENSLTLSALTVHAPEEWDKDNVLFVIREYTYDSTKISISDLEILHNYIGEILKESKR